MKIAPLHNKRWREPYCAASLYEQALNFQPKMLSMRARGAWWEILAEHKLTLLATREYEHCILSFDPIEQKQTFFPLPHPSGMAVEPKTNRVFVASTRNPNQLLSFAPTTSELFDRPVLLPQSSQFLAGHFYLHDLAFIGSELYANATGLNAVVRLSQNTNPDLAWWPRSIRAKFRRCGQNVIQLNSIAAGQTLEDSYFSASCAHAGKSRPGELNFEVDKRGVIFSGKTRTVICQGLTRPHSARLYRGKLWVLNSGYGELGVVIDGSFCPLCRLPGWTRGLFIHRGIAFVGTSRILPRFAHYAPGLSPRSSRCAIHAVELRTGKTLGSCEMPHGDQIFALDAVPSAKCQGFPIDKLSSANLQRASRVFYSTQPRSTR